MAYSTTHEEKLSQEELSKIQETQEQTLADYYYRRMQYWDSHIVKNVSQ
jgi:bisphosphoglycerate-dependent phosphoglycerate mutase